MLERCNSLWIGARLGPIERACLKSVIRQGHPLSLYCYRPPEGVPAGVELRDAADILPETSIVRHKSGSVSLFSNWFRYELQRRGKGIWLDCDHYLLAPVRRTRPHLFGEEEPGRIATGIFHAPPDSPLLPPLLAIFREREVPWWLPRRERISARLRLMLTGRTGVEQMLWGVAGPRAVTALAARHGLSGEAEPPGVHYPVHYHHAAWIRDPSRRLADMVGPETIGLHLWNEMIKDWKDAPAHPESFLARLQREGAL